MMLKNDNKVTNRQLLHAEAQSKNADENQKSFSLLPTVHSLQVNPTLACFKNELESREDARSLRALQFLLSINRQKLHFKYQCGTSCTQTTSNKKSKPSDHLHSSTKLKKNHVICLKYTPVTQSIECLIFSCMLEPFNVYGGQESLKTICHL